MSLVCPKCGAPPKYYLLPRLMLVDGVPTYLNLWACEAGHNFLEIDGEGFQPDPAPQD